MQKTTSNKTTVADELAETLIDRAREAAAELEQSAQATTYRRAQKLRTLAGKLRIAADAAERTGLSA